MAGDWIKLEHATIDKPEVMHMAEVLGITQDEMIGKLVRYLVWLDRNSCNGYVTHVSLQNLDTVTQCAGFGAALLSADWAKLDLSTGKLTVKHWDRHNGNPAKTRALTNKRVKRKRNAANSANALPEKRREELLKKHVVPNTKATARATAKTLLENKQTNGHDKPPADRWDQSEEGIDRMGRTLGMIADTSDTYQTFAAKLWQRINETLSNPPHQSPP